MLADMNTFFGEMRGRTWRTCRKPSPVTNRTNYDCWVSEFEGDVLRKNGTKQTLLEHGIRQSPPAPRGHAQICATLPNEQDKHADTTTERARDDRDKDSTRTETTETVLGVIS